MTETDPSARLDPLAQVDPSTQVDPLAQADRRTGVLAWMAKNSVAANLLMALLLAGGALLMGRVKQEVLPEFDLDLVLVNVIYPGASPMEVEQGVVLAVEEAVQGLDGVKEVRSTASEGVGVVAVELVRGTNRDRALSDVKAAVDRITSFPVDVERPVVALATNRRRVVSLVVYGDKSHRELRDWAEQIRGELLTDERVTYAELSSVRPVEILVDVSEQKLQQYGLTRSGIAARIRQESVEIPGGTVKTRGGDILIRMTERKYRGSEFASIVLATRPDGSSVRLSDVASVRDDFQENDHESSFWGQPAVMIDVYRMGDQTPITVSDAVHDYLEDNEATLPQGTHMAMWRDMSRMYRQRIDLLMKNAWIGLTLVLLVLGLFLEIKLAFWVTLGIPISFLGSFLFIPGLDVSINMVSLFAFIVTLGMVVDDAIVVGEAVYKRRSEGAAPLAAAIDGVKEVAGPVIFSILTTCIAFTPLLFIPGSTGKFFMVIPIIVITVLLISLVESLLVLPAHLAHTGKPMTWGPLGWVHRGQQRFSRAFEVAVERIYSPLVRWAVEHRYLTLAIGLSMLIACTGIMAGGRLKFVFFPRIESNIINATLVMPYGTPVAVTRAAQQRVERSFLELIKDHGGLETVEGLFAQVGAAEGVRIGTPSDGAVSSGSHVAETMVYMAPPGVRKISTTELARLWRENIGDIPGIENLSFHYSTGPGAGNSIDFELSHSNMPTLEAAARELAQDLGNYGGVIDINDGFSPGKRQMEFQLTAAGRAQGLTASELGRQLRSAFWGAEAVRQQRGRDELKVYVRTVEDDRHSIEGVENFLVRTPNGGQMPLSEVAHMREGRGYTQISHVDGRRSVHVTADVARGANATEVTRDLLKNGIPGLKDRHGGLQVILGGEQARQRETLSSLGSTGSLALLVMFGLLAVAFGSYVQPLIVMVAIPFGFIGALLGHLLLGYNMSLMSAMGLVALSGVVVNDSLILVVAANRYRNEMPLLDAVQAAGVRRFRPILLTSLTTFFGLAPMIAETSMQARFLIPMALSLGFGVLFATFIILLLVPALYVIVDDLRRWTGIWRQWAQGHEQKQEGVP